MQSLILALCLLLPTAPGSQARPDFSGRWVLDAQKTMVPGSDGRVVLAAILGELDGRESKNISPGDVEVLSRTAWEGDRLVIHSRSTSSSGGGAVTIETRRVMWLDGSGDLILERSGSPLAEVTPSRSIYRRAK